MKTAAIGALANDWAHDVALPWLHNKALPWLKSCFAASWSYSHFSKGAQFSKDGTEQTTLSGVTLVGVSADVQIGSIPSKDAITVEYTLGLGKHLGAGVYFGYEPGNPGRVVDSAGIALHGGVGVGTPLTVTGTLPVGSRPRLW